MRALAVLLALGLGFLLPTLRSAERAAKPSPRPRAAVWLADVTPDGPAFAHELGATFARSGWDVDYVDSAAITDGTLLTTNRCALLVVPHARRLPLASVAPVESYLRAGGGLMACGLPAWETPSFRTGDRWLTRAEYDAALHDVRPGRLLLDFTADNAAPAAPVRAARGQVTAADVARWPRHTNHLETKAARSVVPDAGRGALHVTVDDLNGWDTLEPVTTGWAFSPGDTLTCFRAKGSANTRQLAVEWIEQDGSRWIATVNLTPEWRHYALPPDAFRPWQPPTGRGGPEDRLNVRRVARFTIGLALTHTAVEPGKQEYWFADLGTAPNPIGELQNLVPTQAPRLESLSPSYQCYPISTRATIRAPRWQALLRHERPERNQAGASNAFEAQFPEGETALGLHPRPRGVGLDQGRSFRWQPLLVARDAETEDYRGAVAALIAHFKGPYAGGVWTVFTPAAPEFYRQPAMAQWIEQIARRLTWPVYLQEGGSEFFTVFPDQAVRVGARLANLGRDAAPDLQVLLNVIDQSTGKLAHRHQQIVSAAGGETKAVETVWTPRSWPTQGCVVAAQVLADGRVIDEVYHELNRWEPKAKPQFVEVRDGEFHLAGQRWKAQGVNYMPSSGIGVDGEPFENWLGRGAYDPEVIERDLRRVRAMGLNAVSVFTYHRDLPAQHLLDFLFRCERLGLKVNLSLRPGTPMEFRWAEMRALIEHYRIAENDTVFAYDLAWEPSHYDHRYQVQRYAAAWAQWVRHRYGSAEGAARAWSEDTSAPAGPAAAGSGDANPPIPSMVHLTRDGPWRKQVAAYRTFLDELLAEKYAEARRLVRSVDAHHPVSFRMQHAGDPTYNGEGMLPYDLYGLRDAIDIWEPEAYGRIGDWDRVKGGHFTAAYARLCDPAKPVLWAEMGYTAWDQQNQRTDPRRLELAARFYRDFYRMLRESGAAGVFLWWYPGGFRLNESSDFGILNPDGTDRPVTRVIRELGPAFLAAPRWPHPGHWIAVDRDRDARGLFGIYEAVEGEYWRTVEAGETVGLKWERLPGARITTAP